MQNVFVYRNIIKKTYSVKSLKTGLVVAHHNTLALRDCTFRGSLAGRKRVLRERRKNVHAGIKGELISTNEMPFNGRWVEVWYNPYKTKTFVVRSTGKAIDSARYIVLTPNGVWALI
jgi:hypothetical protein